MKTTTEVAASCKIRDQLCVWTFWASHANFGSLLHAYHQFSSTTKSKVCLVLRGEPRARAGVLLFLLFPSCSLWVPNLFSEHVPNSTSLLSHIVLPKVQHSLVYKLKRSATESTFDSGHLKRCFSCGGLNGPKKLAMGPSTRALKKNRVWVHPRTN
jgi:hypothetical protein